LKNIDLAQKGTFLATEEQIAELRSAEAKLEQMRKELEELRFENWLLELVPEKRRAILKHLPHDNIDSPASKGLLREAFAKERRA